MTTTTRPVLPPASPVSPAMRSLMKALGVPVWSPPSAPAPVPAVSPAGRPVAMPLRVMKDATGTPVKAKKRVITIWASVSADEEGNILTDTHGHQIPEDEMEAMAWDFVANVRVIGAGHEVMGVAQLVGSLPLTADIQKALGAKTLRGWLIQVRLPLGEAGDALLAAYESGEWEGASIAGVGEEVPVEDATTTAS